MADKLSWTELRRAISVRAGVSEKKAGAFLNALIAQVVEGLKSEQQVKINGLGTFRLQPVAPRKSVNVTTGEEIVIEGYNKMTFAPEAGVKELIENNSPQPERSLVEDEVTPLKKLGAQAEEIVDILGELGQPPKEEPVEEPAPEPIAEPEPTPEPEPEVIPDVAPEAAPDPVFIPEPVYTDKEEKPKKRFHFLRDTLICVVILLLLLLLGYFFLRNRLAGWIDDMMAPTPTEQVIVVTDSTAVEGEEALAPTNGELSQEEILAEFLEACGEGDATPEESMYEDLITIEPMHQDSRLAWMAWRFYGDKRYWPYLYDANKDHIKNPNVIEVGTPIRVPRLTKAQRDTTSAAFLKLKQEAEAAIR